MPFGVINTPTISIYYMNKIFISYIDPFVVVFIDDIMIYSLIHEKCEKHLRTILYVKLSECEL